MMNIQIQKEIAIAEHRAEFDYAETLKALDLADAPKPSCPNCKDKIKRHQLVIKRARNIFKPEAFAQ